MIGKKKIHTRTNRSLRNLQKLLGDWDMELSRASFLSDPRAKVRGQTSFRWIEGGAFVAMYQGDKATPQSRWLIGKDESKDSYAVLYFDARGVSRMYEMTFKGSTWRMWRSAPGFSQRFRGVVNKRGDSIKAAWERSADGKTWEHDFDVLYVKVTPKSPRRTLRTRR